MTPFAVHREKESYLVKTIESVIHEANNRTDYGLMIYVAEMNQTLVKQIGWVQL